MSKMGHAFGMAAFAIVAISFASAAHAQLPSVLYTWDGTGNVRGWGKNFGTNAVTLSNTIPGTLTITETGTAGEDWALRDDFNLVMESSTATGGLDLTGLDFLEFDLGHNGSGPINVQFYVQASPSSSYIALGSDVSITPGQNTYQLSLPPMTYEQQVYIRTIGYSVRDHVGVGNVVWSLDEVRSGGTPLTVRDLITHNAGTAEGGIQGAIANFDLAAIAGNNGGQNQTGLSHNPSGSGSLQWTDLGGSNGAAITWGNGTAWNSNSFNERPTNLSGYDFVTFRISATDAAGNGGAVDAQAFFQSPGFQAAGILSLPIDGQYHELTFPLAGITGLNTTTWTGLNLGAHAHNIVINVDNIRFSAIPEPATSALAAIALVGGWASARRPRSGRRSA